jgi:hypothetical protein
MKKKITNLRYKRSKKQKKNVKKGKTYKKYKGGECNNFSNCFFIKGHAEKKRAGYFIVPNNMELLFYSKEGFCSPAWFNDIRDVCYDIGLQQEFRRNDFDEKTYRTGEKCPEYKITGFSQDAPGYAAAIAGLYICPDFYPNYNEQRNVQAPVVPIYSDGSMLLSDLVSHIDNTSNRPMNKVNILFCRGSNLRDSQKFYRIIERIPFENLLTDEYNSGLYDSFSENMVYTN